MRPEDSTSRALWSLEELCLGYRVSWTIGWLSWQGMNVSSDADTQKWENSKSLFLLCRSSDISPALRSVLLQFPLVSISNCSQLSSIAFLGVSPRLRFGGGKVSEVDRGETFHRFPLNGFTLYEFVLFLARVERLIELSRQYGWQTLCGSGKVLTTKSQTLKPPPSGRLIIIGQAHTDTGRREATRAPPSIGHLEKSNKLSVNKNLYF